MIGDIFQPTHLIFIFVVALLVLGPKRLPEVGRSLGKGIRDFRGAMAGIEDQARDVFDHNETPAASAEPTPPPVELPAPMPADAPVVSSAAVPEASPAIPVAASAPATTQAVWGATSSSVARSGSGLAEPDPDDYAD